MTTECLALYYGLGSVAALLAMFVGFLGYLLGKAERKS